MDSLDVVQWSERFEEEIIWNKVLFSNVSEDVRAIFYNLHVLLRIGFQVIDTHIAMRLNEILKITVVSDLFYFRVLLVLSF